MLKIEKVKNKFSLTEIFKNDINRMILLMFFCIFLYNLGHPATPDLIELRHLNKSISGVFLAIMSSSMFLSSPYLGALADSIGMKKIFIFMPIMYGLAQVFFGFSNSLLVMMLARIMAGFASGGTYAVVLGYVSQISKKEEKSKNIAKISSIAIVGGAIGQKVGGLIGLVDTRYPFGMQLIFGILVSLLIFIFMNEIVKKDKNEEDKEKKNLNPLSTFKYIYELDRNSKFFCFIIFLSGIGIYSYASAVNYFLKFYIKVNSNTIGTYVMFTSLIAFLGTSFLLSFLLKKFKERKIYIAMLFIGIILMITILFRLRLGRVSYILMAIYAMTYEIVRTLGNSIIAQKSKGKQGKILGVASSVSFLGNAMGSLLSGYILEANMYLPFIVNIVIITCVLVLLVTKKKRNERKEI